MKVYLDQWPPGSSPESIRLVQASYDLRRVGASLEKKVDVLIRRIVIFPTICLVVIGLAISVGCSNSTQAAKAPEPLAVEVVQVEQKDVPIYSEWIGTLDGLVNADIKAQVSGYLLKQAYAEGSSVQKGQLLFEIDPRPFQAVLEQPRASSRRRMGNWRKRGHSSLEMSDR